MRGSRGVALVTAILLLVLVLVIGLALASSSMLSLNLARQTYLDARCSYQARSAVNELIARLQKLEAAQDVQLFNPKPMDLKQHFPGRFELVPGCWIAFDHAEPGYSTDNLLGEGSAAGWADRGGPTTSVPPFTLELILHARQGAHERRYRALVRRTWPYAIYSGGGPVVLSGDPDYDAATGVPRPNPDPAKGSHVVGRIFSSVRPDLDFRFEALDYSPRRTLFQWLTSGLQPERNYSVPLTVGPPLTLKTGVHTTLGDPKPIRPVDEPTHYSIKSLRPEDNGTTVQTRGNSSVGSVDYSDVRKQRNRQAQVTEGNSFQGRVNLRDLPTRRNPLSNLKPHTGEGYAEWLPNARSVISSTLDYTDPYSPRAVPAHIIVPWPPPPLTVYPAEKQPTWVIWGKHSLVGTSGSNYFVVKGNLVNRIVGHGLKDMPEGGFPGGYIPVEEYGFELNVEDCLLHVKGDLDLCDISGRDPTIKGITGNGATIIVEGSLAITGASIRAGDRGMVIYANNIALAGSGEFAGLLVASSGISIVPQAGKRIKIRGGVVTAGNAFNVEGKPGVALHNVDVQYDPRYLKSLSFCGDYVLTAWEQL